MKVSMDRTGRIVIPRAVRDLAQLRAGVPLEIRVHNGVVELEPAPSAARLVKKGRWSVAVPARAGKALTLDDVNAVVDTLRGGSRG